MSDTILELICDGFISTSDLKRATDFTLEARGDHGLAPLEDATDYVIRIGLPDHPTPPCAWTFVSLEDALTALDELRQTYPDAGRWLSTARIQTEMLGDNVWEGVVFAQAEIDTFDENCDWVRLSRLIVRADADEVSIWRLLKDWLDGHEVSYLVGIVIDHL